MSSATLKKDVVTVDVSGRPVVLHVPACASASAPAPLVISLHAWGTTAKEQQDIDRFLELSEEECFAVAYPQGLRRAWGPFGLGGFAWNAGGCCPNASQ